VSVDTESLNALGSSIDQSQSVGLASSELEFCKSSAISARSGIPSGHCGTVEVHLAIYQVVVRSWFWVATVCERFHDFLHNLKVLGVIPVIEEDWTKINIVVGIRRTVDD
jgi:hypothetical protein